jgi:hypothetical protein
MAKTEPRVGGQSMKAAAFAIGEAERAAGVEDLRRSNDWIGGDGGANNCGVHEFVLFLVSDGPLGKARLPRGKGVHTPHCD